MSKFVKVIEQLTDLHSNMLYGEDISWVTDPNSEYWPDDVSPETRALLEGCTVKSVAQHGGEGQGDTIYGVYKVTDPNGNVKHYRANGWYASYNGSDWESIEEVVAKEVTVTEWSRAT